MKSPRKLGSLLLLLLATGAITITFLLATTSKPTNHQTFRPGMYTLQAGSEPSGHLVDAALRKADFPQMLSPTERAAMRLPVRMPNGSTLIPDHSLMVEAIAVVEDPSLTWDPCLQQATGNGGNPNGAWTFNTLMLAIAGLPAGSNPQPAEQMLMNVLADFAYPNGVTIGNFTAQQRPAATNFFNHWPLDTNTEDMCTNPLTQGRQVCLSLAQAPVHLNAIVNRVDTGRLSTSSNQAGQLRFVFGVTMDPTDSTGHQCESSGSQSFNIILEYTVPPNTLSNGFTALGWAQAWAALSNDCPNGFTSPDCNARGGGPGDFNFDLNQIVSRVVGAGQGGPDTPNGSALFDIRTNEAELGPLAIWEMRQFKLQTVGTQDTLVETAVPQTPDASYDEGIGTDFMGSPIAFCSFYHNEIMGQPNCQTPTNQIQTLIQLNNSLILQGGFTVPSSFLGVSALNGPGGAGVTEDAVYWDSSPSMAGPPPVDPDARVIFAAAPQFSDVHTPGGIDGTCNGCHGRETQTAFQQVVNRSSGTTLDVPSVLSAFLVGCTQGTTTGPCPLADLVPLNSASTSSETVIDPVNAGQTNTFGDIQRRFNCMSKILNNPTQNVVCNGQGN